MSCKHLQTVTPEYEVGDHVLRLLYILLDILVLDNKSVSDEIEDNSANYPSQI